MMKDSTYTRRIMLATLSGAAIGSLVRPRLARAQQGNIRSIHDALPTARECMPRALLIASCPSWPIIRPLRREPEKADFAPSEWQHLLRVAFVLQRTPARTLEGVFVIFHALAAHCEEFGGGYPFTKPTILLRLMFDLPEDRIANAEMEDSPVPICDGRPFRLLADDGIASISTPIAWSRCDGPSLTALYAPYGAGGRINVSDSQTVFRHFFTKYQYRTDLNSYIDHSAPEWNDLVDNGYLGIEHWNADGDIDDCIL